MSKNYDFVLSCIHAYNNAHFLLPNRNPLYSGANTGGGGDMKKNFPILIQSLCSLISVLVHWISTGNYEPACIETKRGTLICKLTRIHSALCQSLDFSSAPDPLNESGYEFLLQDWSYVSTS